MGEIFYIVFVYLLVNFGGPRDLDEIRPFLTELLTDRDVIRTPFPGWFHNWLFGQIAKRRSGKLREDYELIGGRSPIFSDTEMIAKSLSKKLSAPVLTFHRYLPATHKESIQKIIEAKGDTIRVIPLFPQFSYATTGSIARFLSKRLPKETVKKLHWIPSFATHPAFIASHIARLTEFLKTKNIGEENLLLLFSAHGLPQSFVNDGDPYQSHCVASYQAIRAAFPKAKTQLCYQSKFGPGLWLKPYTEEFCENLETEKEVVIVPLSFTSDHIETLYEIEHLYVEPLRSRGLKAHRCPALNLEPHWIDALAEIANIPNTETSLKLIRGFLKDS